MRGKGASASLAAVMTALVIGACSGSGAVVDTVDADKAARILAEDSTAILLDIRTPDEFAGARLEGAINIDFYAPDFAARLAELDRETTYVIYCRSGNRTTAALDIFRDLGFESVHAVEGGIVAWQSTGRNVVGG